MLDIDTIKETHTWQYMLTVNPRSRDGCCYVRSLLRLCPSFSSDFQLDITYFDQEDRQCIKAFLLEHQLNYNVDQLLQPCDD